MPESHLILGRVVEAQDDVLRHAPLIGDDDALNGGANGQDVDLHVVGVAQYDGNGATEVLSGCNPMRDGFRSRCDTNGFLYRKHG